MLRNAYVKALAVLALCASVLTGCSTPSAKHGASYIAGAWFVKMPEAPFQYHMLIFNADGTVLQSNPDAGDPHTSDSNGMGAWVTEGDRIIGKFVEVTADRATHAFASRGDIAFNIQINGDTFSGTGSANFYDTHGALTGGPIPFTLSGTRIRAK